jgi:actin-related protein
MTGCLLECGGEVSFSVPVYEGVALNSASNSLMLGGRDITCGFMKNITREVAEKIKLEYAYVALDPEEDEKLGSEVERIYKLPDNQTIIVGKDRFLGPEQLFKPGSGTDGIHKMIHSSIQKCNELKREELFKTIILGGGSSLKSGMKDRLTKELCGLESNHTIKVVAHRRSTILCFLWRFNIHHIPFLHQLMHEQRTVSRNWARFLVQEI